MFRCSNIYKQLSLECGFEIHEAAIGKGSSSTVHRIDTHPDRVAKVVAISSLHDREHLITEFRTAIIFSNHGVGPTVFHTQLIDLIVDGDEISFGIIIMCRYQMSLVNFIRRYGFDKTTAVQLNKLFKRSSRLKLLCMDTNPGNIMVNVDENIVSHMVMIDFGGEFIAKIDDEYLTHALTLVLFYMSSYSDFVLAGDGMSSLCHTVSELYDTHSTLKGVLRHFIQSPSRYSKTILNNMYHYNGSVDDENVLYDILDQIW